MKSHWITHKGKRIFYIDCSNLDLPGLTAEIKAVVEVITQQPERSVCTLTDVRGTNGSPEAVQLFKISGVAMKRHFARQAVIGVSGVRMILLQAVNKVTGQNARPFNDLEEAKEWLGSLEQGVKDETSST